VQAERRPQHAVASEDQEYQDNNGERQHLYDTRRDIDAGDPQRRRGDRYTPDSRAPIDSQCGFPRASIASTIAVKPERFVA
jgi:hypothetical protein